MLAEYRYRVKEQFEVLGQNAQAQKEKLEAVVAGITPILQLRRPGHGCSARRQGGRPGLRH